MDSVLLANAGTLKKVALGSHRRSVHIFDDYIPSAVDGDDKSIEKPVRTERKPLRKRAILPLFVALGIALNMPFAALNGAIVYFSSMFGQTYYLNFMAAFNIPAIPLLTLQLLYDETMDKKYGSKKTFSFRIIGTFTIMAASLCAIPFMVHNFIYVMVFIALIGVANGIAFGSIFQLGSLFSSKGTACIFAGLGIGNIITTLGIVYIKYVRDMVVLGFFGSQAVLTGLGVVAVIGVMSTKQLTMVLAKKDEESHAADLEGQRLLSADNDYASSGSMNGDSTSNMSKKKKPVEWRTTLMVLGKTWKSQVSMFISFSTGTTIMSFLSYIPPQTMNWGVFQLLALYINIYGDFLGKNLTFFPSFIKNDVQLLCLSTLRSGYLVYFFLYLTIENFPRNDYVILAGMGVVAIVGGYLTNLMFTIAPKSVHSKYTQQVASAVTIMLHIAVYTSIGVSYLLNSQLHFIYVY